MKTLQFLQVYANSAAASLLSSNGVCVSSAAAGIVYNINRAAKENYTFITFWQGNKITFECIFKHTVTIPAKALQSLESLEAWTVNRIAHFNELDSKRKGF